MAVGVLNPADAWRVREVVAEEFAAMSPSMQALLRMRWQELCDQALPIASESLKTFCPLTRPAENEAQIR
jgi:hypothetical protein